jgi:DNA helicase II / ATP-dependent DNA helicase PcrA
MISGRYSYGTHQGVKGLEFDRVFVVIDDSEAKGFLFSYEKLFGAKPPSAGDEQRSAEGTETAVDRTRRLLYVTCTRARRSLALVAYTANPDGLAAAVVRHGWFAPDELERM